MSGLSITICYLSIYLSIYGGVVEGGGGGPRAGGAPTTPNQLWGGPACKSLRTPDLVNLIMEIRECLNKQNASYSVSLDGAAASLH